MSQDRRTVVLNKAGRERRFFEFTEVRAEELVEKHLYFRGGGSLHSAKKDWNWSLGPADTNTDESYSSLKVSCRCTYYRIEMRRKRSEAILVLELCRLLFSFQSLSPARVGPLAGKRFRVLEKRV